MLRAATAYTFSTSGRHRQVKKWTEHVGFCTCSLPNMLCTTTTSTFSKLKCFVHFHFQICLAPQRHALFRRLHFQKRSRAEVLCRCSLPHMLRATTACNFSILICPDVSAPAALASLPFDPSEPQNTGKIQCFATSLYTFSRTCIFSLPDLLLLIFSMSGLLPSCGAFPSVHIVRSLA